MDDETEDSLAQAGALDNSDDDSQGENANDGDGKDIHSNSQRDGAVAAAAAEQVSYSWTKTQIFFEANYRMLLFFFFLPAGEKEVDPRVAVILLIYYIQSLHAHKV